MTLRELRSRTSNTHTIEPELLAVSVIPVGQNLTRIGTSVVAKTPTDDELRFWARYVAIDIWEPLSNPCRSE